MVNLPEGFRKIAYVARPIIPTVSFREIASVARPIIPTISKLEEIVRIRWLTCLPYYSGNY